MIKRKCPPLAVIQHHLETGATEPEIARLLGCHRDTIHYAVKKAGVPQKKGVPFRTEGHRRMRAWELVQLGYSEKEAMIMTGVDHIPIMQEEQENPYPAFLTFRHGHERLGYYRYL